jgi:hypothetical protein
MLSDKIVKLTWKGFALSFGEFVFGAAGAAASRELAFTISSKPIRDKLGNL